MYTHSTHVYALKPQEIDKEMKQEDIKAGIVQAMVMRCSCELNLSNIVGDIFSY